MTRIIITQDVAKVIQGPSIVAGVGIPDTLAAVVEQPGVGGVIIRQVVNGDTVLSILSVAGVGNVGTTGMDDLTLSTDGNEQFRLNAAGGMQFKDAAEFGTTTRVSAAAHFPTAVAGVITLPAGSTWEVTGAIDLGTDRIECAGTVTIAGIGQETNSLTSSLGATVAMIDTSSTITLRSISLITNAGAVGVRVNGGGTAALDWFAVNFRGGRAAELTNVANSVNVLIGCFDDGVYVYGTIETLAFTDSIFTPDTGEIGVCVDTGAVVSRRLRFVDTAVVVAGTGLGLHVPAATVPSEGFIMSLVNFAGTGTFVDGIAYTDDEARWIECRGVTNTTRVGVMNMEGNGTATTIATQNVFVKAAGITALSGVSQRFSMPLNNQLQYDAALTETFRVVVTLTVTSTNNKQVAALGMLNGVTPLTPASRSTTNSGGRAEGLMYQGVTTLNTGDYIETWIANETNDDNVTVIDMSVQIIQV